jgi:HNH endonuclease
VTQVSAVFADLVRLCAELHKLSRRGDLRAAAAGSDREGGPGSDGAGTVISREALEQPIVGKAVDLLSGPGGLASFVRQRQLGLRLAGPSLPLDIGVSKAIPAGIRNLVCLRDRHCRFPGCRRPAAVCEVHHIRHKAHGGTTSVKNCVLLCRYHHQIAIHRQGWTLVLNPDGTTTA